jgi:hypothetical protein
LIKIDSQDGSHYLKKISSSKMSDEDHLINDFSSKLMIGDTTPPFEDRIKAIEQSIANISNKIEDISINKELSPEKNNKSKMEKVSQNLQEKVVKNLTERIDTLDGNYLELIDDLNVKIIPAIINAKSIADGVGKRLDKFFQNRNNNKFLKDGEKKGAKVYWEQLYENYQSRPSNKRPIAENNSPSKQMDIEKTSKERETKGNDYKKQCFRSGGYNRYTKVKVLYIKKPSSTKGDSESDGKMDSDHQEYETYIKENTKPVNYRETKDTNGSRRNEGRGYRSPSFDSQN